MFALLLFSGQQGYVVYKDYKKVNNKLDKIKTNRLASVKPEAAFTLFSQAPRLEKNAIQVKSALSAEIEGIVSSDEKWLSFAVIKTPSGARSYREGESLGGFDGAWVDEINSDNVVVQYQGEKQVLALKKPDYFKGGVESGQVVKSSKDVGADNLHLDDYLVLKPLIEQGQLEGYKINPRNASSFFHDEGLEYGDVVVKVDSADMTQAAQAKNILANWSKMKAAEVVVRRHAHLENIQVNVINN